MKKMFAAAVGLLAAVPAAYAGGPAAVVTEPQVYAPVIVAAPAVNWTGGYVGAMLGYGKLETGTPRSSKSTGVGALVAGYDHDFGQWVLGGELMAAPGAGVEIGGREVENFLGARMKAGYKMDPSGRWLGQGSLGYARVSHEAVGGGDSRTTSAPMFGLGVSYLHSRNVSLTGEILSIRDGGDGPRGTTLLLGAHYRF